MYIRRHRPSERAALQALRARALGADSLGAAPEHLRGVGGSLDEFEARIRPGSEAILVACDAVGHMIALALIALDVARSDQAIALLWVAEHDVAVVGAAALVDDMVAMATRAGLEALDLHVLESEAAPAPVRVANRFAAARARRVTAGAVGGGLVRRLA